MEQKRAYNILFSYNKSAQEVRLGYHEVFGLVRLAKKKVTKKTAQNSPKSTIWRKNWHTKLFFGLRTFFALFAHFFCFHYDLKKQRYVLHIVDLGLFWAVFLSLFFGAIEPAQKLCGTLDPPAAHFFW